MGIRTKFRDNSVSQFQPNNSACSLAKVAAVGAENQNEINKFRTCMQLYITVSGMYARTYRASMSYAVLEDCLSLIHI